MTEDNKGRLASLADNMQRLRANALGKLQEWEAKGTKVAGQAAWKPAGVLIDLYGMDSLLGLTSGHEQSLFQALTAAELGRQVNEPFLNYITEQAIGIVNPSTPALPGEISSTDLIKYLNGANSRRNPTTSAVTEAALRATLIATSHLIRKASARFETELPGVIARDPDIDDAEKVRLLGILPQLGSAAREFVGQVAGDGLGLLYAPHSEAALDILKQHGNSVRDIAQKYQVRP